MPDWNEYQELFVPPESAGSGEAEPGSSEANLFAGKLPIKVALEQLRLRLLDLSGRNRQINFKHTAGKSLQFVHTSIDATFRRLTADTLNKVNITALPEPDRGDWSLRNGRLTRPEPKDHATRIGIDPSYELMRLGGRAVALVFDDEDEELEVEIGDLVAYAPADTLNQLIHVRITARQTDPAQGLVAENTPLGTVLLGATVGETVVLRVPGKTAQSFVIQRIKRLPERATS